jgi:hypothetical protein
MIAHQREWEGSRWEFPAHPEHAAIVKEESDDGNNREKF